VIHHFAHSEPGGHRDNQDCWEVRRHASEPPLYLCAVADGQGGQSGAALASGTACKACLDIASSCSREKLLSPSTWPGILQAADKAVADCAGAGYTTLVAFGLTEKMVCGSSSGDSAAVVVNPGLGPDILTDNQVKNPPVGSGAAVFEPFGLCLFSPWTLLALTDGVWKYAGWDSVIAAATRSTGDAILRTLRQKAALRRTGGLQDDFTLVVFQG
jgi:hypothetical protein